MPIFATLKEIIEICWRERMNALKFGAAPFTINLAVALVVTSEAATTSAEIIKNNAVALASLLIYASFAVAWYRLIVNGPSDVSQRGVFVITKHEWRFFGWTLVISVLTALCTIPLGIAGVIVYFALALLNKALATAVVVVLALVGIAYLFMVLTRWSLGLAMVATGQSMNLKMAWDLGKPFGWRLVNIQGIIGLGAVATIGLLSAPFLAEYVASLPAGTALSPAMPIPIIFISHIGSVVVLMLSATMYALAYRQAMAGMDMVGSGVPIIEEN